MLGLAIFRCPLSLLSALQPCGPFPQRALPRVSGTTDHSATLTARPAPYGVPVAVCLSTDRASRVATSLIFHACQRQYPGEPSWCPCRSLPKTCQSSPYQRKVDTHIDRFEDDGRDPSFLGPPAQIRTCALTHPAPPLGCTRMRDGESSCRPVVADPQFRPIALYQCFQLLPRRLIPLGSST